jgi:hypothetical protein
VKVERQTVTLSQLRVELCEFEARFGVPTAELEQAFTVAIDRCGDQDYTRWSMVRSAVALLEGHRRTGSGA